MRYEQNSDLPSAVREQLPNDAQETYLIAFNGAVRKYGSDRVAVAHRIAWAAVERSFVQPIPGLWVRFAGLA